VGVAPPVRAVGEQFVQAPHQQRVLAVERSGAPSEPDTLLALG